MLPRKTNWPFKQGSGPVLIDTHATISRLSLRQGLNYPNQKE